MGGPGSLDGLCFGNRPNGHGGAGLSVRPPMGLTVPLGAGDDGEEGVDGSATAVEERPFPLTTPTKPPLGSHDLSCNGLLDARRFAAAPSVTTVSEDAAALIAGAAIVKLGGEGLCVTNRLRRRRREYDRYWNVQCSRSEVRPVGWTVDSAP